MGIDTAIEYADQLLYERTGKHLSDLQSYILQQSWKGKTYRQVAKLAGYSEGHVKDVASQLWQLLSEALGERITKGNLRSRLINRLKRTVKSTVKSATPQSLHPLMSSSAAKVSAALADVSTSAPTVQSVSAQSASVQSALAQSANFIGRTQAIDALQSLTQTHRIVVVQGEGGIGKTTLTQQFCQRFSHCLELLMAKESNNITPIESVVEEWLRQHFEEEPGRDFGVTLSRLKYHLQQPSEEDSGENSEGQNVCILIDNLEPALDGNGQFIAEHRRYVELLRVLAATPAKVIITSRDRLCEPSLKVHHYRLPGLGIDAWQQFFEAHQTDTQTAEHVRILRNMHRAYGGNAKAMEILCAAAIEDFEGDLSGYWQENGANLLGTADLRNLVGSQVVRLQQLDTDAYRVFCRLGCYRYQDQARLDAAAIMALMWDIEPHQQRQTINSLRDRSLLEFSKGHYWLHPVSRAEAIARLRNGEDWSRANHAAAQYWSDRTPKILSVEDGLRALEAYYHLIAAEDYDGAAAVLLKSRHNQWRQFLPLASSLYRMGLLQPVINAITQVLPHVSLRRSELNNILGDVYWITGQIHGAIACQKQTLAETAKTLAMQPVPDNARDAYYLKMLTVDAHLSIGLYCIDLWELTQAAEQFEQVISLAANSSHQAWADKATVGLALTHAYQNNTTAAMELANSIAQRFTAGPDDEHGRYAYFLQLLGQTFGQLGMVAQAQALYEQAMASAEASHYVQVKAKTLTGMAVLQRQQRRYKEAVELHREAIALCKAIGATCDLAEACLQLGLTQLALVREDGGAERDDEQPIEAPVSFSCCFSQAAALFSEICAPQQVSRVSAAESS